MNEFEIEDDTPQRPSKSELKRQAEAAQQLGKRLLELNDKQLAKLDLAEELRDAIVQARGMRASSGRKRQLQLIGKLMRREDVAAIEQTLQKILEPHRHEVAEFHQAERWRERLLHDPAALQAFIDDHPHVDRQNLRQLLRNAQREMAGTGHGKAYRGLFRLIKQAIDHSKNEH